MSPALAPVPVLPEIKILAAGISCPGACHSLLAPASLKETRARTERSQEGKGGERKKDVWLSGLVILDYTHTHTHTHTHILDKVSLFYISYFIHPYWDRGWPQTLGDG